MKKINFVQIPCNFIGLAFCKNWIKEDKPMIAIVLMSENAFDKVSDLNILDLGKIYNFKWNNPYCCNCKS